MPPADPKLWTVLERIRTDLASITAGANYNFTPHRVRVVSGGEGLWPADDLDESLGSPAVVYLIRRGARQFGRKATGDGVNGPRDQAVVTVQVLVAQRFTASTNTDTPTETLVLEQMAQDVIRKLTFEDPGLGATVDADDVLSGDDARVEEPPENWTIGALTFQVTYDYFSSAP